MNDKLKLLTLGERISDDNCVMETGTFLLDEDQTLLQLSRHGNEITVLKILYDCLPEEILGIVGEYDRLYYADREIISQIFDLAEEDFEIEDISCQEGLVLILQYVLQTGIYIIKSTGNSNVLHDLDEYELTDTFLKAIQKYADEEAF